MKFPLLWYKTTSVVGATATVPLCYLYMDPCPCWAQYNVRFEVRAATGPGPGKDGSSPLYSV